MACVACVCVSAQANLFRSDRSLTSEQTVPKLNGLNDEVKKLGGVSFLEKESSADTAVADEKKREADVAARGAAAQETFDAEAAAAALAG